MQQSIYMTTYTNSSCQSFHPLILFKICNYFLPLSKHILKSASYIRTRIECNTYIKNP